MKRRTGDNPGGIARQFEQFLEAYNCDWHCKTNESEPRLQYMFDFQGGHFLANIRSADDSVEVVMPCFATASINELDLVRAKCNERNNANILFKFTYVVDHESNDISLHMSFFNNIVRPREMEHQLTACFYFQREWQRDYDEALQLMKGDDSKDLENAYNEHQHQMFLLRRQEMLHQTDNQELATALDASQEELPLETLLKLAAPLTGEPNWKANAILLHKNGDVAPIFPPEGMKLDLRRVLLNGKKGNDIDFEAYFAMLEMWYDTGNKKNHFMTVLLTAEGDDGNALYTRITVTIPPHNVDRAHALSNPTNQAQCISLLTAYERTTPDKRKQEFDYMWQEAKLKMENGEEESMTEDQRLLGDVTDANVGYCLYWGDRMFNTGRYGDAIIYYENAFESWRGRFFDMDETDKRVLLEIAYKIGFCYCELKMYEKAYYYMDLLADDGSITHTMELVNVLANNKDLRVFSVLDDVMQALHDHWDKKQDEMPPPVMSLIHFLRRRRAYALIEFGKLDDAEEIFKSMLDEEENADYAINELAYIKKLREQQQGKGKEKGKGKGRKKSDS